MSHRFRTFALATVAVLTSLALQPPVITPVAAAPTPMVVTAYGNPLTALPKACWPDHLLTGADTVWRFAVCRSLDVLPIGMRVQLRCLDDRMVGGGWARPLPAETVRSLGRQGYLWEQGRGRPGPIVTNVRDARLGFHHWGLAVDLIHPTRYWDHPRWFHWLAIHAEACGLVAGAFWKSFPDRPHIQFAAIESMSRAPPHIRRLLANGDRESLWLVLGASR